MDMGEKIKELTAEYLNVKRENVCDDSIIREVLTADE